MTPPSAIIDGHTPDHKNCPVCEASRMRILRPEEFGCLRFCDAAPLWLREHRLEIGYKTYRDYLDYLKGLLKFFGEMVLSDIHIGNVEQYQEWRKAPRQDPDGRTRKAGPSHINHEVNTLAQILGRAGLWVAIDRFYRPLKLPKKGIGRAMTDEQEERLFLVASTEPRWLVAYCASLLTVNTSAGPSEILQIRLRDIDTARRTLTIWEKIKNQFRERTVYLNDTALWSMQTLLKRAKNKGCYQPEHYLLPHRAQRLGEKFDPTRPMGSWKQAWNSLRKKADLPELRMYDLRHHIITKLLEDPDVSDKTAQEIAGHISNRMQERYSHIRLKRKKEALEAVETKQPESQLALPLSFANVIEFKLPEVVGSRK